MITSSHKIDMKVQKIGMLTKQNISTIISSN